MKVTYQYGGKKSQKGFLPFLTILGDQQSIKGAILIL